MPVPSLDSDTTRMLSRLAIAPLVVSPASSVCTAHPVNTRVNTAVP